MLLTLLSLFQAGGSREAGQAPDLLVGARAVQEVDGPRVLGKKRPRVHEGERHASQSEVMATLLAMGEKASQIAALQEREAAQRRAPSAYCCWQSLPWAA